jgi:hypothetical protein
MESWGAAHQTKRLDADVSLGMLVTSIDGVEIVKPERQRTFLWRAAPVSAPLLLSPGWCRRTRSDRRSNVLYFRCQPLLSPIGTKSSTVSSSYGISLASSHATSAFCEPPKPTTQCRSLSESPATYAASSPVEISLDQPESPFGHAPIALSQRSACSAQLPHYCENIHYCEYIHGHMIHGDTCSKTMLVFTLQPHVFCSP